VLSQPDNSVKQFVTKIKNHSQMLWFLSLQSQMFPFYHQAQNKYTPQHARVKAYYFFFIFELTGSLYAPLLNDNGSI
jgi:hypothetical protein